MDHLKKKKVVKKKVVKKKVVKKKVVKKKVVKVVENSFTNILPQIGRRILD